MYREKTKNIINLGILSYPWLMKNWGLLSISTRVALVRSFNFMTKKLETLAYLGAGGSMGNRFSVFYSSKPISGYKIDNQGNK